MSPRVVLVEDDPDIGGSIRSTLVANGYEAQWHTTGTAAVRALEADRCDLVILDVGLPDIDGFTLCRWLREKDRYVPIIMLTARDADIDAVVGLDAGATDYVTKPFSMSVLLARIRAHLRVRAENTEAAPLTIGRLHIETAAYTARIADEAIELRPREFELLVRLAREQGKVVTREQLMSDVWDEHWHGSTKTLDMHVMALRKKLDDAIEITAVRGVGYRLDPR